MATLNKTFISLPPLISTASESISQHKVLALVAELAQRYQISAIHPFIESCRSALERAG
jgi:hypothetical protein